MASEIFLGGETVGGLSNARFDVQISFALEVASETARSDAEREWTERLRRWFDEEKFDGIGLDLDARFPSVEEKKFWTRVYYDTARRIFLRQLGNQETTCWQTRAIVDASTIGGLLLGAVQQSDHSWFPDTEDSQEERSYLNSKFNRPGNA